MGIVLWGWEFGRDYELSIYIFIKLSLLFYCMGDTLKSKLDALHMIKSDVASAGVELGSGEFRKIELAAWSNFYRGNPMAQDVAKGNDSYLERIKPVVEKYDSYLERAFLPSREDGFDKNALGVFSSINGVGVGYIDPQPFNIEKRRKDFRGSQKAHIIFGLCSGGAIAIPSLMLGAIMAPVTYLAFSLYAGSTDDSTMKIYLSNMQKIAGDAEVFLRENSK